MLSDARGGLANGRLFLSECSDWPAAREDSVATSVPIIYTTEQ